MTDRSAYVPSGTSFTIETCLSKQGIPFRMYCSKTSIQHLPWCHHCAGYLLCAMLCPYIIMDASLITSPQSEQECTNFDSSIGYWCNNDMTGLVPMIMGLWA